MRRKSEYTSGSIASSALRSPLLQSIRSCVTPCFGVSSSVINVSREILQLIPQKVLRVQRVQRVLRVGKPLDFGVVRLSLPQGVESGESRNLTLSGLSRLPRLSRLSGLSRL